MKIYNFNEFEKTLDNYSQIDEGIFGIGSISAPKIELTSDYIREHTPEEIGELFFNNASYWMDNVKGDVNKAIENFCNKTEEIWVELKNQADLSKKYVNAIVLSVKTAISEKYNDIKKYATSLPNVIVFGICYLVKLGVSVFDEAKTAVINLCKDISEYMNKLYSEISNKLKDAGDKMQQVMESMKDKMTIFVKISAGIIVITSKKIAGIGDDLNKWVIGIINEAKANSQLAIMLVNDWVSSKVQEIRNFVENSVSDVADSVKTIWKNISNNVKKTWGKITDKLQDWMNSIKLVAGDIAKKIESVAKSAGEKLISIKDAGASTVIKKGIKALNKKNYSLDDVIDMVTAAYNESVVVMSNGNVMLNETAFYKTLGVGELLYN